MQLLHPLLLLLLLLVSVSTSNAAAAAAVTAPAPAAPAPPVSLTAVMSKKGCTLFADLLTATADAATTFQQNVDSGLTVFCPNDAAVKAFAPKFKNLTADAKVSLLLYQAIPVYNSMEMLKNGNGVVNTLATDGTSKNYNFTVQNEGEAVTLSTGVTKAAITATVVDKGTLAVYAIDTVLEPRELFKVAHAPTPAPAPAPEAEAPVADKKAKSPPAPAPDAPQSAPADKKKGVADDKAGGVVCREAGWWTTVAVTAAGVVMMAV